MSTGIPIDQLPSATTPLGGTELIALVQAGNTVKTPISNIPTTGGSGTVQSVSVVNGNGFKGTVSNPTTTPAIEMGTTVNGIMKGDGNTASAATAGTDYQLPIVLTTSGVGASTFSGDALNIPKDITQGINSFVVSPAVAPAITTTNLSITLPNGVASVNGYNVAIPAISYTSPINTITDIWLNQDGTLHYETQPLDMYPFLPHFTDKLLVWKMSSNASKIVSLSLPSNTYPTVFCPTDITGTIDTFCSLLYLLNGTTNWSASLTVTYAELLLTAAGNVYLVIAGGVTGSVAPTSTDPTIPITNGSAILQYVCTQEYIGMFRFAQNSGIEYYFANVGLHKVCHKILKAGNSFTPPAGTLMTTLVKNHILGVFKNLLTPRQNSGTYQLGMKMIAGGYIWRCTTAGISAASSPYSGSYTPGTSTITDGTAVFKCIFTSYASQQYFWLDTGADFVTYHGPDSHDSYAATLCNLIARYIALTGDYQWMLTNSTQPNSYSGYLTYKALLDNIVYFNLSTQIAAGHFLTYGFQFGINPQNGSAYDIQQLEDNCEVVSGYFDYAYILGAVGDYSGQATALANSAYIDSGVGALYNSTYNLLQTYYGQDITTWVNNPNVSWYPYLQAQLFPQLCNIVSINDDQRSLIKYNIAVRWPSYFYDKSLDSFPNNFVGFMAAKYWQDTAKAYAFIEKTERYFISGGTVAQGAYTTGGPSDIAEWGYYLAIKDALIPPLTLLNTKNGRMNLLDTGDMAKVLYTNVPLTVTGKTAAFTIDLPANCYITDIFVNETTGHAVTGGLDIGTTLSGADVVSAFAVGANSIAMIPAASILKKVFSRSATQTLYFAAHTSFNSASLDVEVRYNSL